MFVDPATGDQSNMAQLPRYLDGRGGQLSIRFPGSVEYCSDTNGGDLQYAVRSIFNDAYSKAAVTIGLPEQGTDHIGYVTLASGEITDLTEPRVTSGFSEDKLLETNAAFGPDNHLLFLRSGSTDLLAQQVDQTDVAPWNQANVGVVADPGDDGRGAPLPAITVGPTGTATPSAISIVYDTNPWVPSRFGPRSIAGKLNDCPTADCVQVGDPTSIENDDTTVVSVRSTSSASDCRPLAWIAKNRVVCSSDSSADADQPSQLLTIGTLSSAGPRLAIEPLTVVAPRELSNAVLSPDEKTVAFVSSDEDGKTVYTAPLAAPAPVEPTRVSQLDDNMILIGWR